MMRTRAGMAVLAACTVLTFAACKEKQEQAPAATPKAPAQPSRERPSLPGEEAPAPAAPAESGKAGETAPRPSKPLAIADATAVLPKIDGTQIIPLKQTSDQTQVHGTWCVDGTSADDVAKKVGQSLAQAGFTNITIRGDERKAGVAGDREGIRLSMVVSASAAQICAAPAHYFASATLFRL